MPKVGHHPQLHLLTFRPGKKQETPSSLLLLQRAVRARRANQVPSVLALVGSGNWEGGKEGRKEGRKGGREGGSEAETGADLSLGSTD